jgi:hypothetical protein
MAVYLDSTYGTWRLPLGRTLLGRSERCGIRLDDMRVSRRHAALHVEAGGRLQVDDLGAANGVLVNDERIGANAPLHDGDVMVVGPFVFRVRVEPDTEDPSRLHAPAVAGSSLAGPDTDRIAAPQPRSVSEEFLPSTDRHLRKTIDMEPEELPPAAAAARIPVPARRDAALTSRMPEARRSVAAGIRAAATPAPERQREPTPRVPGTRHATRTDRLEPLDERRASSEALLPRGVTTAAAAAGRLRPLAALAIDLAGCALVMVLGAVLATAVAIVGSGLMTGQSAGFSIGGVQTALATWRGSHTAAYAVLVGGLALGGLLAVLAWLFWWPVPTMLHGAPLGQRALGLILHDRHGEYPGPLRSLLRSLLALPLLPLDALALLAGLRPPCDLLSGCRQRRRG